MTIRIRISNYIEELSGAYADLMGEVKKSLLSAAPAIIEKDCAHDPGLKAIARAIEANTASVRQAQEFVARIKEVQDLLEMHNKLSVIQKSG